MIEIMISPSTTSPAHMALPVINSSAKIEELRQMATDAGARAAGARDAAATGRDPQSPGPHNAHNLIDRALDPATTPLQKALIEKVVAVLRTIYDPELPVNIYDLGLIYNVQINPDNHVHISMTLTAPACPVAGSLPPEVERRVETVEEVRSCDVELVWEPPWSKASMSEAALLELGLL